MTTRIAPVGACWCRLPSFDAGLRHAAQAARARHVRGAAQERTTSPEAAKKSPSLVAGVREELGEKAREEWQSNDLEESRRDALMAHIKLKTALALLDQEQLKAKISTLSAEHAKAQEEATDLTEKLSNETEKVALLRRTSRRAGRPTPISSDCRSGEQGRRRRRNNERLALQLASEQKIAAAQLALRTAETVDASKFAKAEYSAASDMLAKAERRDEAERLRRRAGERRGREEERRQGDRDRQAALRAAEQTSQNKVARRGAGA